MSINTLGITPLESSVSNLVAGSSYPLMYAEIGLMHASISNRADSTGNGWTQGAAVPEKLFRPRFLTLCSKGFICWADEGQVWENWKDRRFILTKRGEAAIRAFQIEHGGAEDYYRGFDGSLDSLDRYMGTKVKIGPGHNPSMGKIFEDHNKNPWALNKRY